MIQDTGRSKLNTEQIELHLKSAVDMLTPDILSRIDLSIPQDAVPRPIETAYDNAIAFRRKMQGLVMATAACFCVVAVGGGAFHYGYQNRKVDSVIGIDVNPSVELSINRRNKVLSVEALNEDAGEIMEDMDLKGVELNVAVNAVIGSMVTHGYLDDLDNAILVTVSNDSISKATQLRTSVVDDIERTLVENQVHAVVYDQQVIEKDEMKELAERYGISYGKAYFLTELINQNKNLTMDDMEELSSMTMEEIASRIVESSYILGELAEEVKETVPLPETEPETETEATESSVEETTAEITTSAVVPVVEATSAATPSTEKEETDRVEADRVEIDYVDCEGDTIYVYFVTRVKWKNPTVSVRDDEGNSYTAMVDDTSSSECSIRADHLEGGKTYTFVLGGLIPVEGGNPTTVTGYFEKPEIAAGVEEEDKDDDKPEEAENVDVGKQPLEGETSGSQASEKPSEERKPADEKIGASESQAEESTAASLKEKTEDSAISGERKQGSSEDE